MVAELVTTDDKDKPTNQLDQKTVKVPKQEFVKRLDYTAVQMTDAVTDQSYNREHSTARTSRASRS